MSNVMSNIKPNEWYDAFAEFSSLDNPIDRTKNEAILLKESDEYLEKFYMKIWVYQKSKLSEGIDVWDKHYYNNDIFGIIKEDFDNFYFNIFHDFSGYFEFLKEYNNCDGNKSWIEPLKKKSTS